MPAAHHACMTTQQIGFSILTAPLAAIDRRSLSQAWYSALHLATHDRPQNERAISPARRGARACVEAHEPASPQRGLRVTELRVVPHRSEASSRCLPHEERRTSRSRLARQIERTFLDPARRGIVRATFTIGGTRTRVHVALQWGAAGARLVAVCPPAARDRVARALEEARYALAVRGIALRIDVNQE